MTEEEYLTPEEVAKKLRVSDDLVLKWLKSGELVGYRLARNVVRIKTAELDRFLEERKTTKSDQES